MDIAQLEEHIRTVLGETFCVEFKSTFDPTADRDRCKLVKTIVAMYNSGGGAIVFGLDSEGNACGDGIRHPVDPKNIVEKVRRYTAVNIDGIVVRPFVREGAHYQGWAIPPSDGVYVPFTANGEWSGTNGARQNEFYSGQILVRHGAQNEVATREDLSRWRDKIADAAREKFAKQIAHIATYSDSEQLSVVKAGVPPAAPTATQSAAPVAVRLTSDPKAPAAVQLNFDVTHPYRQKELLQEICRSLPDTTVNSYDITCIKKVHQETLNTNGWLHKPKHSTMQYHRDLVPWIVEQIRKDTQFLVTTREAYTIPP